MDQRITFFALLIFSTCLIGCNKQFRLHHGEELRTSNWQYPRCNLEATASVSSDFGGQLNLKWEKSLSEVPIGPMTIGAGQLIFSGSKGRIYFFDPETGRYGGRLRFPDPVPPGVIVADSVGYLATAPEHDRLICVNLYSRKVVWSFPLKEVTGSPIIVDNRLIVSSDTGTAICFERFSGRVMWKAMLGSKSVAGPSYDFGTIYMPIDNGVLKSLDTADGQTVFEVDLHEPLVSKSAVGDKVYVAGAAGHFYALDKRTGEIAWQQQFPWPVWTSPAIDENLVFMADNGGIMRALDKADGRVIWEFAAKGVIVASPIVVGNYILFASLDKNVYCLNKATGLLVSKRELKHEIRFPAVSDGKRIFFAAQDGTIHCFGD